MLNQLTKTTAPQPARFSGTVEWFSDGKGYGFIVADGSAKPDIFVHHTAIQMEGYRRLDGGDRVAFELVDTHKGPAAINVVRLHE